MRVTFLKRVTVGFLTMAFSQFLLAESVLIVLDGADFDHTNARDGLVTKFTASGDTITQETSNALPADISPFDQLWDIRADTAITPAEQTQIVNFLNSGKRAFVMGENSSYGASRNPTVAALVTALGGGNLTFVSASDTQTINPPLNGGASTVTYPASYSFDTPGTGIFVTEATPGVGAAVAWGPGTMSAAATGTLAIVLDVNFLQPTFWNNPSYPGTEELADGLLDFVGGAITVTPTPTAPYTPIPTLAEWSLITLAMLLGGVVFVRRKQLT